MTVDKASAGIPQFPEQGGIQPTRKDSSAPQVETWSNWKTDIENEGTISRRVACIDTAHIPQHAAEQANTIAPSTYPKKTANAPGIPEEQVAGHIALPQGKAKEEANHVGSVSQKVMIKQEMQTVQKELGQIEQRQKDNRESVVTMRKEAQEWRGKKEAAAEDTAKALEENATKIENEMDAKIKPLQEQLLVLRKKLGELEASAAPLKPLISEKLKKGKTNEGIEWLAVYKKFTNGEKIGNERSQRQLMDNERSTIELGSGKKKTVLAKTKTEAKLEVGQCRSVVSERFASKIKEYLEGQPAVTNCLAKIDAENKRENALDMLRYQVQDLMTQMTFGIDTTTIQGMAMDYLSKNYRYTDLKSLPEQQKKKIGSVDIPYNLDVKQNKLIVTAPKIFFILNEKDNIVGCDAIQFEITVDLEQFDPTKVLFDQKDGVVQFTSKRAVDSGVKVLKSVKDVKSTLKERSSKPAAFTM